MCDKIQLSFFLLWIVRRNHEATTTFPVLCHPGEERARKQKPTCTLEQDQPNKN